MKKNNGLQFEATLALSWVASNIPLVRMKLAETGILMPCDERIDFEEFRIFNELKSTKDTKFSLSQLKEHQLQSLYNWHNKFNNSLGLVTIEFRSIHTAYIIDIETLITLGTDGATTNTITPGIIEEYDNYKLRHKGNIYVIKKDFLNFLKKACIRKKLKERL